jgi:prevent-host-death family protein
MCEITATEFKRNFGKYMDLGQKEEIMVTHRGKPIFKIIPQKVDLAKRWESLFGTLSRDAFSDDNINRE